MSQEAETQTRTKKSIWFVSLWMLLAGLLTFQMYPGLPQSDRQWFLFLAFGPPLYVLSEAFFSWLFSAQNGQAISQQRFSLTRIAVALPVALIWFGVYWWLTWWYSKQ